jgi:oligopeptidase B
MKYLLLTLLSSSLFSLPAICQTPPVAQKVPKELVAHKHKRIDNYFWMNQRENPKVAEHLNAENAYTAEVLKSTLELQDKLYKEIVGRIKQTDMSVPFKENGYWYFSRYEEGHEYPIFSRKKETLDAPEEILLNVNELAKGHSYFRVGGVTIPINNEIMAFSYDTMGRNNFTIRFMNLSSRELLPGVIHNTTGNIVFANDSKTLFYSIKDKSLRSFKILKHKLGQKEKKDEIVYHEKDATFDTYVTKTKSRKYIIIASTSTVSDEMRILDADNPDEAFRVFQPRERGLEYNIDHFEDKFYVTTNYNAKNFRLMATGLDKTSKENWVDIIPHRADVRLEDVEIFKDLNKLIKSLTLPEKL